MSTEDDLPTPEDFRKQDLLKAFKILLYSGVSALVFTILIYFLPI